MSTESDTPTNNQKLAWASLRAKSRTLQITARRRELERYKAKKLLEFLAEC